MNPQLDGAPGRRHEGTTEFIERLPRPCKLPLESVAFGDQDAELLPGWLPAAGNGDTGMLRSIAPSPEAAWQVDHIAGLGW
jgi:hypothetical protein